MLLSYNLLLALCGVIGAAPLDPRNTPCMEPQLRKEWRQLSESEQENYIIAVKCLTNKPSRLGLDTSLYDDFPYVHTLLNNEIHAVASFLPWHRYFVSVYESALHDCGYHGTAIYWDWTLDTADVPSSPVFSATQGFGGNGSPIKQVTLNDGTTRNCIADGPLVDLTPAYFGSSRFSHCIIRNFNNGTSQPGNMLSPNYTPEAVQPIQELPDYNQYRIKLEGTPHGAIHSAIGGDMSPSTSPNDPIFFLHHGQIDRLWWLWQQQDPEVRNSEYSGIRTQDQFDGVTPPPAAVSDVMKMMGLAEDVPVSAYLTTESESLCYRY